jgi:hypothetical protein
MTPPGPQPTRHSTATYPGRCCCSCCCCCDCWVCSLRNVHVQVEAPLLVCLCNGCEDVLQPVHALSTAQHPVEVNLALTDACTGARVDLRGCDSSSSSSSRLDVSVCEQDSVPLALP